VKQPLPSTNEPQVHPFLQEVIDALVPRKLVGHRPYCVRVNPKLAGPLMGLQVLADKGHGLGIPVVVDPKCERFEVVG
jgi:hypothetical protein